MKMRSIARAAALGTALLASACAKIVAPPMDFAGPAPSVDLRATGTSALLSHFTAGLTVGAISVQHAGPVMPTTSAAAAGSSAGTSTYRISAVPTFSVDDTLTVTWRGTAVTLVGSSYTVEQRAVYHFVAGTLKVQTPWGGLGPGQSGKVCVALLPHAPSDTNVLLSSSTVTLAPGSVHISAGQAKASAAATATIGAFACPLPSSGATAAGPAQPPPCDATNGVIAAATFGGITIHGCGKLAQSCCGIGGHNCSAPAPPPSICPP